MDAIALAMFGEPAVMPIPARESPPANESVFAALVAVATETVAKEADAPTEAPADPVAQQLDTSTPLPPPPVLPAPTDKAAQQPGSATAVPPPFVFRQWRVQSETPLQTKLLSLLEKFQTDAGVPQAVAPPSFSMHVAEHPETAQSARMSSSVWESDLSVPANDFESPDTPALPVAVDANLLVQTYVSSQPHAATLSKPSQAIADQLQEARPPASVVRNPDATLGRDSDEAKQNVPRGVSDSGFAQRPALAPIQRANSAAIPDTRVDTPPDPTERAVPHPSRTNDATALTSEGSRSGQTTETQAMAHRFLPAPAPLPTLDSPPLTAGSQSDTAPLVPEAAIAPNVFAPGDNAAEMSVKLAIATRDSEAAPMETLALHIAARTARGDSRFTIRLDPPELGQIEVNLSVTHHGHAQAVLAVEKPQTLELLQRDAAALERALKDAGFDLGNNLSFSLKEEGRPHLGRDDQYTATPQILELVPSDAAIAHSALSPILLEQLYGLRALRLDITV